MSWSSSYASHHCYLENPYVPMWDYMQSCRTVVNRIVNSDYFMVITFKVVHVVRLYNQNVVSMFTPDYLKLRPIELSLWQFRQLNSCQSCQYWQLWQRVVVKSCHGDNFKANRVVKKDVVTGTTLTTLKSSIGDNLMTTRMKTFCFVCMVLE